jgi:hypothetical protein
MTRSESCPRDVAGFTRRVAPDAYYIGHIDVTSTDAASNVTIRASPTQTAA